MNHPSGKKRKRSPNPSPKRDSLGTPTDVAAGPLRSREELGIGPDDERNNKRSRIIFQDDSNEDKGLPVPGVSASRVVIGGTEDRNDPTREHAADTGEGEGGGKLAGASKVPEGGYKNTALAAPVILSDVPREVVDESGPLGPLKAVLRTIAAIYVNNQETIAIGKIEYLLSRVVALEERFGSRPGNVEEQRRREKAKREFYRIEEQLRSLSEKPEPRQLADHVQDDGEVPRLLEDLRGTIFNYQVAQQEEIYNQRRKLIKTGQKTPPAFNGGGLSTEDRNDPTREHAADTGEGEGGGKLAGASKVPEGGYKNTALAAPVILSDVPREVVDESGPLGPLKAVLRTIAAIYVNNQETIAIGKIEYLLSRVVALEERFGSRPGNVEEQRRREKAKREFYRIEEQLRSLSEKPEPRQLADHVQDDGEVPRLLEDLRGTIFNYQVAQQEEIYNQRRKLIEAEHRHGDRKACLKRTRGAVLDKIDIWARDFDEPPVYWLNGLAGTGKSTIAQTIAERIFADGKLGASFFCSRDFEDRSNLRLIFPTIAVQLARNYTKFRSIFVPLVQSDPEITHESLYNQMKKLIVQPLKESEISTVIVLDALDECKDVEPASAILSVLGQFVSKIPKVKFFITGRPEPRVREGFRIPLLAEATDVFVLHEVESSRVDSDIQLFFRHRFLEIADRRGGLNDWPTEEQLNLLCERAAGLFVCAVATVQFVDHRNNDPKGQLDRLLRSPEKSVQEGKANLKVDTTLDSLYTSILQEAFGDDGPEDDHKTRSVLGAVILAANPLPPSAIATLLDFSAKDVSLRLSSAHSLLIFQENTDSPVRPFHKSFPDFIVDPPRCIDQRFHVSPPDHHVELLIGCLNQMNQSLEKNMCKLPDAVTNSEVPDLRERTERYISSALQYACKSWHKHLVDEHTVRTPEITSALHWFLENKFVFWLEVLSVLGAAREAVDALDLVTKWLEASPTLELANDCFRFVTGFFEIIDESAAHIYHSALPVSPQTSMVRKLYEPHANSMARIVHGLPVSWDLAIVTMECSQVLVASWSPCGRFIAIADSGSRTEIRDAATLKRLTILESLEGRTERLVFSPDARLLMRYSAKTDKNFTSWDLQTGVMVSAIPPEQWDNYTCCFSITYSACGTMFGALTHRTNVSTIRTYNVHSGTHIYSHPVGERVVDNIWTYGECLRFAVVKRGSITTWEVGFASRNPPTEIESLPLPDNSPYYLEPRSFHPTLSRLAFDRLKTISVWDARHSKFLLDEDTIQPDWVSFSSDGRFFMYREGYSEIYLWKESLTGYILHRKLNCETGVSRSLISPNGESIFAFSSQTIQLWRTMDSTAASPRKQSHERLMVEFSPDETLATVTRLKDRAIAVLDLESGDPLSVIDTGIEVHGQRVTGSTVVAVGYEKVVTWNLPARDHVLNPKAGVKNSIRVETISRPATAFLPFLKFASISPNLHSITTVMDSMFGHDPLLYLHDVPTGKWLEPVSMRGEGYGRPWFTSDGREVWYVTDHGEANGLAVVEDSKSGVIKLEYLEPTRQPPNTPPWLSSRGYQIMDDGWILGIGGKRLLRLPPHWRSLDANRMWSGRFLALSHSALPEAVILELEE
ncbi:hypothetical protein BDM02DRAFT_3203014 [Thelephora ganbajun]|uniref:Uncharacterized protein n=1 Tax=Thelephora ganbajun TaxID=370292 RepID=A0ACB6Z850_THEGA|nr:hypothetical protein BDM02DRAFT_3203014 [Thelephora ganbajun]